jgi:hypothetical protein
MDMLVRLKTLLPLIVVCSGCYSYAPTTLDAVPEGAQVRAIITTERQAALRSQIGMNDDTVAGEVVEKRSDRLLLSVRTASTADGLGNRSLYQRVEIPQQDVLRVDVRKVSPAKTAGIVAVTSGGVVLLLNQVLGEQNPGDSDGGGGGPPESVTGWLPRVPTVP